MRGLVVSASQGQCFIRLWSSAGPSRVFFWAVRTWTWTRYLRPISGSGISIDALSGAEPDTIAEVVLPSARCGILNPEPTSHKREGQRNQERVVPVSLAKTVDQAHALKKGTHQQEVHLDGGARRSGVMSIRIPLRPAPDNLRTARSATTRWSGNSPLASKISLHCFASLTGRVLQRTARWLARRRRARCDRHRRLGRRQPRYRQRIQRR